MRKTKAEFSKDREKGGIEIRREKSEILEIRG